MSLCGMVKFNFSMCIKHIEIAKWQGIITTYYKCKLGKFGTECLGFFSPLADLLF